MIFIIFMLFIFAILLLITFYILKRIDKFLAIKKISKKN